MDLVFGIGASHLQVFIPLILLIVALMIPFIDKIDKRYRDPLVVLTTLMSGIFAVIVF